MVWAVYAPRFVFASIFVILNSIGQTMVYLLDSDNAVEKPEFPENDMAEARRAQMFGNESPEPSFKKP